MPNKKNSASCFSLPRCQMTKALRHPLRKSSREGDQPQSQPSLLPCPLSPPSPAPTPTHQPTDPPRPKSQRQVGFSFRFPGGTATRLQPKAGFSLVRQFKAAAAQTGAKFFHKLAPVADALSWENILLVSSQSQILFLSLRAGSSVLPAASKSGGLRTQQPRCVSSSHARITQKSVPSLRGGPGK